MAKASELRKDVINVRTGRRLGELADVEIDEQNGRITALVVPGPARLWGLLGGDQDIVIPWTKIVRIGPDCILVDWDRDDWTPVLHHGGGAGGSGFPAG